MDETAMINETLRWACLIAALALVAAFATMLASMRKHEINAYEAPLQAMLRNLALHSGLASGPNQFQGQFRVTGLVHGRNLTVDATTKYRIFPWYSRETRVQITLSVNAEDNLELSLSERGFFRRLFGSLAISELWNNSEPPERRFSIRGHPNDLMNHVLSSFRVREKLNSPHPISFQLREKTLVCQRKGYRVNSEEVEFFLDLLSEVAAAVEIYQLREQLAEK